MLSLALTLLAATPDAGAADATLVMQRVREVAALRPQRIAAGAPPLDPSVYEKAAAGRVQTGLVPVEGHKAKKAWGVAVIDVPIQAYWAAVNDDRKKVEWTKLEAAEVLQGEYCTFPRRVFQFAAVPLITDRWWVIDVTENETLRTSTSGRVREQRWKTDGDFTVTSEAAKTWSEQGIPIAFTEGAWFLVDLDGKSTLVEYYTFADPGGSIPAGLASSLSASSIDDTLVKMGEMAKAGTTCPQR